MKQTHSRGVLVPSDCHTGLKGRMLSENAVDYSLALVVDFRRSQGMVGGRGKEPRL